MKALSVTTYTALRNKVRETLLLGQRKIEAAKVQTYWDTGHFINQHIQVNGGRAEYGQKIVRRLAEDIDLHPSVLQRCSQFAEIFQDFKIVATWRQLAWAHFRILMTIPAKKIREEFARRANRENWNVAKLQQAVLFKVRNLLCDESGKALEGKAPSLLPVPVLGPFYTYQVIAPETVHSTSKQLLLDLGFSCRLEMEIFLPKKFPAGTIVTSSKNAKGSYALAPYGVRGTTNDVLYTYKAYVERVVDGDTLHLEFRLGFGQLREETIRLRGIDCPEINTPEGKAAKRFVEREFGPCEFITIKSTQTRKEKWGRYLGDVFYIDKTGKQVYLNNLLLEKGHAVRVRS
jgi:endonuclease YncB( thermonuclease family)